MFLGLMLGLLCDPSGSLQAADHEQKTVVSAREVHEEIRVE